jgi:hypothetical protein
MASQVFSFCHFHLLRLLRAQPGVFAALSISSLFVIGGSLVYLQQWQSFNNTTLELAELRANKSQALAKAHVDVNANHIPLALPGFQSAALVNTFHQLAQENKFPLNEVSYALDDSANQPYLRYRVTLTVASTYPVIRRFVDQIGTHLPNVALDAISCAREDIAIVELNCDLVFSAIFAKDGLG